MKKLFNHTKRPKEQWNDNEQNYDWDEIYQESEGGYPEEAYYAGDGAEYAEEVYAAGNGEYVEETYAGGAEYAEGMYEEGAEYEAGVYDAGTGEYVEETYAGGAKYAEGMYEEGVEYAEGTYAEGAYEGAAEYVDGTYEGTAEYADGVYAEGTEYADGIYEEGVAYTEEAYAEAAYEDDIYYEDEYADIRNGGKGNVFGRLWESLLNMSGLDRIITVTGVAVLLLAVVTGVVLVGTSVLNKQISEFVAVGKQLDGIDTIGERGLVVLTDNRIAKLQAAAVVEDEKNGGAEYNEANYNKDVKVSLETTSIYKDLKIKFVNKNTEKLIANVPFAVTVTKPDGKSEIWSDDDMDGIIYKKDIAAGNYTLSVNELTGEKYENYTLPASGKSVEVKKEIAYKKVDVKNEIKKESEINLSKEEAKKNQLAVESSLTDTVSWVESTTTALTYREVSKSVIPDPRTLARSGSFMRLNETGTVSENEAPQTPDPTPDPATIILDRSSITVEVGKTIEITATVTGSESDKSVSAESKTPGVATVLVDGKTVRITGVAAGSATITVTHPGDSTKTADCTVEVTAPAVESKIALDKTSISSLAVGGKDTIKVTLESDKKISKDNVTSSNTGVATVAVDDNNTITVTGVAAGSADITVKHPDKSLTAVCKVTVLAAGSISLNKKSMTLISGEKDTITVTLDNSKALKSDGAESSNTDIVKVEVSGNTVTVTGVAAGSADITIKHPDGNLTEKCTVTVKDGGSLLKDKDGNQVYVKEGDNYREAKYSDYDAIQQDKYKAFIKGEAKYTGWQTLNGKVYFFNANGDKVTGEQVIQGAKYNFASDGSLVQGNGTMGIDVSRYNGNIDWNAVKNSGVSYVIIRVGYRGYTEGSLVDDSKFSTNIKGATAAGLKVGVYFFTQAVDQVEAVEEASMVLERIKGYTISYPVFLDVEASGGKGRADSLSKESRTAVCKAFCETIQNSGYTAGVYANKTWLNEKIDPSQLSAYKIWLAQYAAAPTYKGRYDMWQYKSTGKVSGISGNVDMNISYLGY